MSRDHPTHEEIQKKLSEFLKKQFGDRVVFAGIVPQPQQGVPEPSDGQFGETPLSFEFNFKPRELKDHLDRFVIRQDEAKKALAIAVCDHYNHVRMVEQDEALARKQAKDGKSTEYAKQNVILLGPTGVGKTYLVRSIAQLIGVPFVKADATKYSETGYVGGDVEDLVRELVQRADGNVRLAQFGIIYIDEIDKIASPPSLMGRDVSGRGVQTNLLKLMEETEVTLRSPSDLPSQIQAAMEFQRKGKLKRENINTRHILFIVSGAFDQLEEIIRGRLRHRQIGFKSEEQQEILHADLFREVTTADFVKFGFEPEFIGRLPVRVVCDCLSEDDLYEILVKSEGSIINQYARSFRAFGIETLFKPEGLRAIARLAATEQTGARGLMTVCERIFRDFKFFLPSTSIHSFEIDARMVANPKAAMQELLACEAQQEHSVLVGAVNDFCDRFNQRHRLILRLEQATIDRIVERAKIEKCNVRDVCAAFFKDYEFGLNLVKKNTGQTEFTIPPAALEDPDRFLSQLVVGSYRKGMVSIENMS